jgi:hypothetical protein
MNKLLTENKQERGFLFDDVDHTRCDVCHPPLRSASLFIVGLKIPQMIL